MVLWFAGLGILLAWLIFRDPAFDYRLLAAGAVIPDLADGPFGGARVMHTLAVAVLLLALVMLSTRGRRVLRRHLLAIPIGVFLHLVLDGAWADTHVFWWPAGGVSFQEASLPIAERGIFVVAIQEMVGAVALWWCAKRFGLRNRAELARFIRTGRLNRELIAGP